MDSVIATALMAVGALGAAVIVVMTIGPSVSVSSLSVLESKQAEATRLKTKMEVLALAKNSSGDRLDAWVKNVGGTTIDDPEDLDLILMRPWNRLDALTYSNSVSGSKVWRTGDQGAIGSSWDRGKTLHVIITLAGDDMLTERDFGLIVSTPGGNTVTRPPENESPLVLNQAAGGGDPTCTYTGDEGEEFLCNGVLFGSTDAESDPLKAVLVSTVSNGFLDFSDDGTFKYTHTGDETATDSFTFKATDGTDTSNVATATITIFPVNDAPVITAPLTAGPVEEEALLTFSNANLISIADTDVGTGDIKMLLTADDGTLTLSSFVGLAFTSGDGTSDSAMAFRGTADNVAAALDGLSYRGNVDFNGPDTVHIMVDDLGNTGKCPVPPPPSDPPCSLLDTGDITVTVNGVNDAPVVTVPIAQAATEEISHLVAPNISVADVDVGNGDLQVTLTVSNGALTLSTTNGLSFTAGSNASSSMTFTGTLASVNTALNNLTYLGELNFDSADTITITVNDLGNTGSGPALSDTETITVNVAGVNDAPVLVGPGPQTATEDILHFLGINFSDVDAGNGQLHLSLSLSLCLRRHPEPEPSQPQRADLHIGRWNQRSLHGVHRNVGQYKYRHEPLQLQG